MRGEKIILLLLVLAWRQGGFGRAQTMVNPTADQLMQIMRSQPGVDIAAPVTATASFDPPQVRPGEKAVYRVTFNATAVSVNLPEKIPAPAGLKIKLNCSGQTMQPVGAEYQNVATFDYDVRPETSGKFILPEFTAEVYGRPVVVPAAELEATTQVAHEPVRQLFVEPSATNVFVGESFNVSVRLPATAAGAIEGLADVQINGDGFVADKNSARQSIHPTVINGRQIPAYVYETSLRPIAAGELSLSAQGFTSGMRFNGPIVITGQVTLSGRPAQFVLLDSEPVRIHVRPLPAGNELPGFLGAVGNYACDPPELATNRLKVGEPVQLKIVVRGENALNRIKPPLPPAADGWQIFPAERGAMVSTAANQRPGAIFKYTLIPLSPGLRATPAIPFSCFDPAREKYVDLTLPALPVTVQAGEMEISADTELMLAENETPKPESRLGPPASAPGWRIGGLVPLQLRAWFPLVQILPALGFCGLWFWDRRRRFLEQHPEIVRRRAARRELRREIRLLTAAAQAGDAEKFVRGAVRCLQVASAPHFPAAPRAIVAGDVWQILTPAERAGQAEGIVRRFFAAADAAAFAGRTEDATALLAEKEGLKKLLLKLERRL